MSKLLHYYNPYTGYGYRLTEHSKLRIWERFETLDIEREFKLFHALMCNELIDDKVANMNVGDELIIKNCFNNKVYIVVLSTDLVLELKTVYRDNYRKQFVPRCGECMYRLYKDNTLHRYVQYW